MIKNCIFLFLITLIFIGCNNTSDSKEVLFVCTHGAARSPIAAAYFNKMAKENKLNYHAVFRGTEPDKTLSPETIKGLNNDNIDPTNWKPQKVSKKDIDQATQIVTFDCMLPAQNNKATLQQWNGTPSISKDYTIARNSIKAKVRQLIKVLKEQ